MIIEITNGVNYASLQIGDHIYYVLGNSLSTIGTIQQSIDSPIYVGTINNLSNTAITINNPSTVPPTGAFIMFSKDKNVNNTSLIGYYAEVKLKNNRTDAAELFSLSSEITVSSK